MLEACESKWDVVKNFIPSWFAAVMGTGIFAITSHMYSMYLPILESFAVFLVYFNLFLFVVFSIPWILRWFLFPENALADLKHPVLSAFYPTFAVSMLVLASDFFTILHSIYWAKIFWILGAVSMIIFSIVVPFQMFKSESIKLEHANPGWFIPPVGLIVASIAGSLLTPYFKGILYELSVIANFFTWGTGFFMYLALFAVIVYRFILHHPLPSVLAPTIWINLGPIGAGIIALINIVNNTPIIHLKEPFYIFSFFFWGFGLWWAIMAIVMTIHYVKNLKLPYGMPWWAFIFPLGAYVGSSYYIYTLFHYEIVNYIGFALYWLLFFFWSITLIKTTIATYHGYPFKGN